MEFQSNISKEEGKKKKPTKDQLEQFRLQKETITPLFLEYYKDLLSLSQKDFEAFLSINIKELPITFRISKIK